MVAVLWCEDVADRLDRLAAFGRPVEYSQAWRRRAWIGSDAHLALLVYDDEIRWLGRAQGTRMWTSVDRLVAVTEIEAIDPVNMATLLDRLPPRHRKTADRQGILPAGAGAAIVHALKGMRPGYSDLIDRLSRGKRIQLPSGRRGELLNQERDAVGVVLGLAKISRVPLRSWSPTPVDVPFLGGLPPTRALEGQLIAHDVERFGSWIQLPSARVEWRVFSDGKNQVFVMNANYTPVEGTLGVDLVYFNEASESFVLVQYKRMQREGNAERPVYRRDGNLSKELERMKQVDELCATHDDGEYRLLPTPSWLKFCLPDSLLLDPSQLTSGMYLTRDHFETLFASKRGNRGGERLDYYEQPRRMSNSLFIELVRDGWIGSRGSGSDEVKRLVQESLTTGRSVVFGAQLPDALPNPNGAPAAAG